MKRRWVWEAVVVVVMDRHFWEMLALACRRQEETVVWEEVSQLSVGATAHSVAVEI